MTLEHKQKPRANGIGEGGEAVEDGVLFHPLIRMKGCPALRHCQGISRTGQSFVAARAIPADRAR
jgi:hypothetical protein